jgi:hypothetical protein
MTEPSANRVDVNTPAKEMSCAGVSNGMGADAFECHRGNLFRNSRGIALDHGMDTEAGQRLAKTIEKNSLGRMAGKRPVNLSITHKSINVSAAREHCEVLERVRHRSLSEVCETF